MAAADPRILRKLTRRVSIGGLMTAIVLSAVIAAYFSPTADLALYSLASLGIAITVIELDLQSALIVYLAGVLLSLAFPGLAAAFPLLVFFGPYPLVRALTDRHFSRWKALLLRLLAGNMLAVLAAALFAWEMTSTLADKTGMFFWPILVVGLQAGLLIYDYALGLLIQFYITRLRRNRHT